MRGRKPKPTVLHRLHGTANATRHRHRAHEPLAEGDLSPEDVPAWLSERQREIWQDAVRRAPRGLLKRIDGPTVAVWAVAVDQHRLAAEMQTRLDADRALPLLAENGKGETVVSTYVGVINRAGIRMIKVASELGFSPAARPRLARGTSSPPVADDNPWAEFRVVNGGGE